MRNYKIIGLTGPTGSGKSAAAKYFEENGYKIIDADKIAREVTSKGSFCLKTLSAVFGEKILNKDNSLNRKVLADIAFSSKKNTQILNDITHPFVYLNVMKTANEYISKGNTKIIYDAPLLFESCGELLCDYVISVLCPKEQRKKRIMKRDNISSEQAELRIKAQHSDDFYKNKSDFYINNNSDLENLLDNVRKILREIK